MAYSEHLHVLNVRVRVSFRDPSLLKKPVFELLPCLTHSFLFRVYLKVVLQGLHPHNGFGLDRFANRCIPCRFMPLATGFLIPALIAILSPSTVLFSLSAYRKRAEKGGFEMFGGFYGRKRVP